MNLFTKMIEEIKASGLPTILYGSGAVSGMVNEYLGKNGIDPAGYAVDREYYKGVDTLRGKPLYIIEDYIAENSCNIVLAFSELSVEWENKLRNSADNARQPNNVYILDFQGYLAMPGDHTRYEEFYKENKPALEKLRDDLCDELSKKALDEFIGQKLSGEYRKPFSDKPQYFEDKIVSFSENEVFVDCGAYNGDTVLEFARELRKAGIPSYKKIFAFEADPKNAEDMRENLAGYDNVEIIPKGVYDRACTLCFDDAGTTGSRISDDGIKIEVTSIDEVVGDEEVTFIKMDIEGSELMALKGAEKTIKRCRPKLAVCVYHRVEDLVTIPQYIQSLGLGYKLYLRNYKANALDCVLYAV